MTKIWGELTWGEMTMGRDDSHSPDLPDSLRRGPGQVKFCCLVVHGQVVFFMGLNLQYSSALKSCFVIFRIFVIFAVFRRIYNVNCMHSK